MSNLQRLVGSNFFRFEVLPQKIVDSRQLKLLVFGRVDRLKVDDNTIDNKYEQLVNNDVILPW